MPSCARSCSSVRKKSARSRSSMFTKTTRARPELLGAAARCASVCTSTPMTPLTVTSAPSTTCSDGDRVALEARLAGRVDQVDLPALPLEVAERRRDRHLALLLVLVPVGDRRALLDDAEPVRRAGLEEHRLDERGLAGAAVTDDGDVADLSGLDCGHARRSSWAGLQAILARRPWLKQRHGSGTNASHTRALLRD